VESLEQKHDDSSIAPELALVKPRVVLLEPAAGSGPGPD
jgi:hypothetical protein